MTNRVGTVRCSRCCLLRSRRVARRAASVPDGLLAKVALLAQPLALLPLPLLGGGGSFRSGGFAEASGRAGLIDFLRLRPGSRLVSGFLFLAALHAWLDLIMDRVDGMLSTNRYG